MRRVAAAAVFALLASGARTLRAQCPDGTPPPCASARGARPAAAPTSVAVLYLENLSRDTSDAYLADGLTEEITSRLGSVPRLRVTGRSVVRRAQQAAGGDALSVGRALNVRYLVEGSLRRSGQRVRVSARLLRASDGVRIWGDDYDRTLSDLLELQEDVAREVAANVTGTLLPGERVALAARPTASPEAYDHYLRGRYLIARRTAAAISQAVAEFSEAARLDPRYAAAEARRAQALTVAFGYGVPLASPDSIGAQARRAADRALRLDSTASDAWMAAGAVRFWFVPYDVPAARQALERAIALDPSNAEAQHTLGVILQTVPDDSLAAQQFLRALALDPTRGVSLLDLAEVRYVQHRLEEARRLVDSAIAVDPLQARPLAMRGVLRLAAGDTAGARQDQEAALAMSSPNVRSYALANLIRLDVMAADTARARARMAELDRTIVLGARALGLETLGLRDSALAVLERGPVLPVDWALMRWPEFDSLRATPRFQRARDRWQRVGHP